MQFPVRRTAVAAVLTAAALVGAPRSAAAAEVTTILKGRVVTINDGAPPGISSGMQALGFTVGTEVTITYTIDDTAQPSPNAQIATIYFDAVVSLSVAGGQYEARYDRGPGAFLESNVTVGNDRVAVNSALDTYLVQGKGSDTGNIVGPGTAGAPVVVTVSLSDPAARAISDENVVQSEDGFSRLTSFVTVSGANGSIVVNLEEAGTQPPGGNVARCVNGQLGAAAKFTSGVLKCFAKSMGQPESKDPGGTKRAACIAKQRAKYEKKFTKSAEAAVRKGGACSLPPESASSVAGDLMRDLESTATSVLFGDDSKAGRQLRSKLLKALATQAGKELGAHAKNAKKPNQTKLDRSLLLAFGRSTKAMDKAVSKAAKQGIDTAAIDVGGLALSLRQLVDNHVGDATGP